ncbi:MFS general substrate transporter [Sphaerulina musiva SO2202]|uniref:MFS general substrate transporter n=1 Tax=Sphaerulina musiva (strain SO2202) TaxID=692275 RepID=N1QKD6_SPHMS|nr:MFS general substrate transporter [Sphaerulina musiva SO2202]EMF16737.1 MFS general substrate transporter [Sphaerulina musiva SO2202]
MSGPHLSSGLLQTGMMATASSEEAVEDDRHDELEVDQDSTNIIRRSNQDASNRLRLQAARSRSSARSQRSYLADGYGPHFPDDKDEQHPTVDPEKAFEVRFSGDDDPDDPKNIREGKKWMVVMICAASSLCVTCASDMYTSTYRQLESEFHVSRLVATIGLTTYVCGLGLGPMFLSPLSEFYGRRNVYIGAYLLFVIWLIPCALAKNIATMLIVRFFDGLAGSAFLSVAGGTVGDMFRREKLSAPMMVYTASPFVGPELGPVIGGFINQFTDWRWTFYVLLIWASIQWLLIIAFVPETYAPVLLRRKAVKLRAATGDDRFKAHIEVLDRSVSKTVLWSCIRPFQLLFFEQMCLNLCLLSAILLGVLYLCFGSFALVFSTNHGFNQYQTGLSFLGILVGMLMGVSCDPLWRKNYSRLVQNNDGVSEPEYRLPPTILGAILTPLALFGFGWTTYSHVHWIVPIIFSAVFGLGNILAFSGIFTFLVEAYPLYAASALAANSFARSSFAAAFPLFGVQLYHQLGYQWASSLLAFISLAMLPFPILFFYRGKRIRSQSRFAQGV